MVVRQLEFALGQQHAVRDDAANGPLVEGDAGARNIAAERREHTDQAGAGIGRAADDLDRGLARRDLDLANAQAVSVGMLLGIDHPGDGEGAELGGGILDRFDLEADGGQRRRQLLQ